MSGFILPTPVPATTGWALADWLDRTWTSPPAAGGTTTITLPQLDPGVMWVLSHMVAFCTSSTATRMRLYAGSVAPGNLRDGTDTGNFDVADWPAGLTVPQAGQLVAQWTGAADGAVATLTVQGQILRQAAG